VWPERWPTDWAVSLVRKFDEMPKRTCPISQWLANDHCTISVDSSGALHRRGYRRRCQRPARNAAAGMLMASGWDMASPCLTCSAVRAPSQSRLR
jgi:hypothetical protein